jgi:hypothetical protein
MAFSDSLDREAAWLNTTGDGLPELPAPNGPFQIIQARWPRVQSTRKTGIYVLRQPGNSAKLNRFGAQRSMLTTHLQLRILWPLTSGVGSAEADQLLLERAIDAVLARVQGPLGDKTHGGRFLSVAENPDYIDLTVDDPEQAIAQGGIFRAQITYSADDADFNN